MKSFCILEQGCSVDEDLTREKKEMFTTEFCDYYRLNWKTHNDPNAFITKQGITWSEGRSLLYSKVPKKYDYYIFIDDDIKFTTNNNATVDTIVNLLEEYTPITGTFFDPDNWMFEKIIVDTIEASKRTVFPISGYDLQVHFFSKKFAEIVFPTIYHGSAASMWYSQWICYKLFPFKQMCFTDVKVENTRHNQHEDNDKPQFSKAELLIWKFYRNAKIKTNLFKAREDIIRENVNIFDKEVDKSFVELNLSDLDKIYDITNKDFINRKVVADNEY